MRNDFDNLCIEIEANFDFRKVLSVMEFIRTQNKSKKVYRTA